MLALLTTSACRPGQVTPDAACQKPAAELARPTPNQLAALAGRYEVTLVNSDPEDGDSLLRGILVLWPNDSARRYMPRTIGRRPGERPLAGRFESHSTTVPNSSKPNEPASGIEPGVEMVDATIYLGGLEYSDAGGDELEVKEITPTGFVGLWSSSAGFSMRVDSRTGRVLRDPGGYFCARRVAQA